MRKILLVVLGVLAGLILLLLVLATAPFSWYCLGSGLLWLLLRSQKAPMPQAAAAYFFWIMVAFGFLAVEYAVVDFLMGRLSDAALYRFENRIDGIHRATEAVKPWQLLVATVAAVLLSYVLPRLPLFAWMGKARRVLSIASLVVGVVSAYSFFAPRPVGKVVSEQRADLRKKDDEARRQSAIAHRVVQEVAAMDPATRAACGAFLEEIAQKGKAEEKELLEGLADDRDAGEGLADDRDVTGEPVERPEVALGDLESQTRSDEAGRNKALEQARALFSDALHAVVPDAEGVVGGLLDALVEKAGEGFVDRLFALWHKQQPQEAVRTADELIAVHEREKIEVKRTEEEEQKRLHEEERVPER